MKPEDRRESCAPQNISSPVQSAAPRAEKLICMRMEKNRDTGMPSQLKERLDETQWAKNILTDGT